MVFYGCAETVAVALSSIDTGDNGVNLSILEISARKVLLGVLGKVISNYVLKPSIVGEVSGFECGNIDRLSIRINSIRRYKFAVIINKKNNIINSIEL